MTAAGFEPSGGLPMSISNFTWILLIGSPPHRIPEVRLVFGPGSPHVDWPLTSRLTRRHKAAKPIAAPHSLHFLPRYQIANRQTIAD